MIFPVIQKVKTYKKFQKTTRLQCNVLLESS